MARSLLFISSNRKFPPIQTHSPSHIGCLMDQRLISNNKFWTVTVTQTFIVKFIYILTEYYHPLALLHTILILQLCQKYPITIAYLLLLWPGHNNNSRHNKRKFMSLFCIQHVVKRHSYVDFENFEKKMERKASTTHKLQH